LNLGFFKDLQSSLKNVEVNKFIDELTDFLNNLNHKNEELGILEQIKKENKVSMISENKMRKGQNEILKNYANATTDEGTMYFISSKSKTDDTYIVFKYEDNKRSTIKLNKKELPLGSGVNSILREEDGKYTLDKNGTEHVKNEIMQMANDLLEEQNTILEEYRKDGHLYMVEEDIEDRIFLKDLSNKSSYVIEEVDFSQKLINEATEGTVFKYQNGEYRFYSRDGFERRYE